jgi:hypothetical protein
MHTPPATSPASLPSASWPLKRVQKYCTLIYVRITPPLDGFLHIDDYDQANTPYRQPYRLRPRQLH